MLYVEGLHMILEVLGGRNIHDTCVEAVSLADVKGEDALYPQKDLRMELDRVLTEWRPWLRERAAKKLAESPDAHPEVLAHWKELAG
jgi:hypothetical protein